MTTHTFLRRRIATRLSAHAAEVGRIADSPSLRDELPALRAAAAEGAEILALYIATQASERVADERAAAGLPIPAAFVR